MRYFATLRVFCAVVFVFLMYQAFCYLLFSLVASAYSSIGVNPHYYIVNYTEFANQSRNIPPRVVEKLNLPYDPCNVLGLC